jgi:ubiquinone/menaquinone biosynthesis C-methylase UbiE
VASVSRETPGISGGDLLVAARPICDYEGTSYRAFFWEGQGREYEDLAERLALSRLLPPQGERLLDVGAGFGRLADLYQGYRQVILLDYATSGLREAQERLGRSERFIYVAADLYRLPLAQGTCDTVVSVRVLHHLVDVPAALQQMAWALRPGGACVLEYANKRNLKAILRYLAGRQKWSPFSKEPYEFAALNFDFHPAWIKRALAKAGFVVEAELAVSYFRHPLLKRLVPARRLAAWDGLLQRTGAVCKLSPSVFVRGRTAGSGSLRYEPLFRCPTCGCQNLSQAQDGLVCPACGAAWGVVDGIYDFKTPLSRGNAGSISAGSADHPLQ